MVEAVASPTRGLLDAEALAGALPPLLLQAERVAATVAQGVHGRRRVGPGESFWQFRRYEQGDAVTAIDWRQTAKSGRAYVREHEWEAAQTLLSWTARGPHMDWRSADHLPTKADRAHLLSLALAALTLRSGERVGLLDPEERPATGRATLSRLAVALERVRGRRNPLPTTAVTRHTTVVMVGDFLEPLDEVERSVRAMAARGGRGHLIQVLDPAEESLPFNGRIRFTDVEGRDSWLVSRTEDVREAYVARLLAHRRALQDICRGFGWTFALHHTDQPPEGPLLALFQILSGSAGGRR